MPGWHHKDHQVLDKGPHLRPFPLLLYTAVHNVFWMVNQQALHPALLRYLQDGGNFGRTEVARCQGNISFRDEIDDIVDLRNKLAVFVEDRERLLLHTNGSDLLHRREARLAELVEMVLGGDSWHPDDARSRFNSRLDGVGVESSDGAVQHTRCCPSGAGRGQERYGYGCR